MYIHIHTYKGQMKIRHRFEKERRYGRGCREGHSRGGKKKENVGSNVIRFQLKCIEWKRHCDCCMLRNKLFTLTSYFLFSNENNV